MIIRLKKLATQKMSKPAGSHKLLPPICMRIILNKRARCPLTITARNMLRGTSLLSKTTVCQSLW